MINDPDQPDPRLVAELVARFEAAAKRLRAQVIEPPGKSDSAQEWNQARAARILAQVEEEIARLKGDAAAWTGKALSDSMARGIAVADRQAREAGVDPGATPEAEGRGVTGTFDLVDRDAVTALARDTLTDLTKAADAMRGQAAGALRRMAATGVTNAQLNAILTGGVIEGKPVEAIRELREALRKVHGDKVTIVGRSGPMEFDVGYYAKMVAVTKTREAVSRARHARLASRGMDLVVVIGRISANFCTAYVDKVFSISGSHPRFPALSSLPGGGPPFHPNCTKGTAPFIESLADPEELEEGGPDEDLGVMLGTQDRTALQKRFNALGGPAQAKARAQRLRGGKR